MSTRCYDTDLNDAAWAWITPYLPAARSGGRLRTTDLCAVLNAIFYLQRTGCQWRLLPREFPCPGTVYHYFRAWKEAAVLAELQRALHEQARLSRGCLPCPSVVILDSQSVKTTERGGTRGFDGHKRVKGRKRHLLVDTLGMVVARRVEAANVSDRRVGARLLAGLQSGFPCIRTVMADAGYESGKLARELKRRHGWRLHITKRRQRAFQVVGLTWIVERTFAWLARNRRLSKDYELKVQTSEAFIDLAAIRLMLTAIARSLTLDAKVIIMDEPSAALTKQEFTHVFATIRELVKDGRSILYVSHRLQEVMEIGDRATVMRDGRTVQEVEVSQVKEQDLVVAMIGRHSSLIERLARKSAPGEVAFQVDSLEGPEGVQVKNFRVRCGEIVGLAGLNGSGRTTFLRTIFGDLKGQCRAKLFGKPYSPTNPRYAIARWIGLVPENRKTEGLLLDASLYRNATLPSLRGKRLVTRRRLVSMAVPILRDLGTKFSSIGQPVSQLSGGNQQKVVLSKWLINHSRFLLLDEPSRGLDVGAKADLYKVVRELQTRASLVASSELDELYANCGTIRVFHEGRVGEVFNPNKHSCEEILHATITGERR